MDTPKFLTLLIVFLLFANSAYARGGGGCFLPGTLIQTEHGEKPIEQLVTGEKIISFSGNDTGISAVSELVKVKRDAYYTIQTGTQEVNATAEHPFYVGNSTYKEASLLKEGDVVYILNGTRMYTAKIRSVKKVDASVDAYNLKVDESHTFFANSFAVHNKGGGGGGGGGFGGHSSGSGGSSPVLTIFIVILWIAIKLYSSSGRSEWSSTTSVNKSKLAAKAQKTSALLSVLVRLDPVWDEQKMKETAKNTFLKLQECWQKRDYAEMEPLMMASLYGQHVAQLGSMKQNHEINRLDNLKLLDTEIVLVKNKNNKLKDEFTVWLKAETMDTIVDDRTGKKIRGDDGVGIFEEFWSFQRQNNAWLLREINQPEEAMNLIGEDNYDENATPMMKKIIYERAGSAAKKNLSISSVREQAQEGAAPSLDSVKSKGEKIHRLLNFLAETDKIWDEQQMKDLVRECFILVNTSVEQRNISQVRDYLTPKLQNEIQAIISGLLTGRRIAQRRNLAVRNIEIVLVRNFNDRAKDEFTAWVSGQAQKVIFDENTKKAVSGDTYVRDFEEYYTFKRSGSIWLLDSIEESHQSRGYIAQENIDEGTSKEMMDWFYSKDRTV